MQKITKLFLSVFIIAVSGTVICYTALILAPNIINLNNYKESFSFEIEKQTGFKVTCEDISFKRSLTPYLKIHLYHTMILYPDGEVFLKLKEADIKVKILPLLFRKIVIQDANFIRPIINIFLYKDFSTSLEKYIDKTKIVNAYGFQFNTLIYNTICENYKLKIKDETINKIFYLEGNNLLIKNAVLNDKAHLILQGALYENEKEYLKYDLDINSVLKNQKRQFSFSPFKPILESNVKGNVYGRLQIGDNNFIKGNIKISDLSLKIDNIILSNNNADLTFKGNEVEIASQIHTSKTDSALLNGKISFGKKKFIDLQTHAKNINLENLVKIISVISESLNIENKLKTLNVKGLLDADFNINSDFKKLKSSGNAKIINGIISHNSLPYSISDINAEVNMDNNKILIEKAQVNINKTPISVKGIVNEDVSFNINAVSENLDLKQLISLFKPEKYIPSNLVQDGKLSFNSNINGVLNKTYLAQTKINLNSLKIKHDNIPISVNSMVINLHNDNQKYKGDITGNNISLLSGKKKVLLNNLKILFDERKITIPENQISLPSQIKFTGNINDYKKTPSGQINFYGKIPSGYIAEFLKEILPLEHKVLGNILTYGKISFTPEETNIKLQANSDLNNYISYIVIKELLNKPSLLNLECDINKNNIQIKDLSLYEGNMSKSKTDLRADLDKLKNIFKITGKIINGNEAIFENLHLVIPNTLTFSTNFWGGEEITLNTDLLLNKHLNNIDIKGEAKILKYNIKKYLTSIKNVSVNFSKDNIRIIAPDVQINNSIMNVVADVIPSYDFKNTVVSNLQVNSMNIDLNNLFSLIEQIPYTSSVLTIKKGMATINDFKILDIKAKDISSDISFDKNILKLNNVTAKAYNGSIDGKIGYDFANRMLDIKLNGKNIDIDSSLYDLSKIEDNLKGKADFISNISLITSNKSQTLKSLNGKITFNAKDGKMGTLGKFEYYLYAQNLLYHGLLNATLNQIAEVISHDKTSQFKTSTGTLFFQNGYIISDDIKTAGTNMSLYIRGRHNMLTNQSNIDIYGRISDEIKHKLGSFGNVSISEIVNGQTKDKNVIVETITNDIISKIPDLYDKKDVKTNLFKVNIFGDITSLNAINSFSWIIPDENQLSGSKEDLPDFDDLIQNL